MIWEQGSFPEKKIKKLLDTFVAAEIREMPTGFAPAIIDPAVLSKRVEDAGFEEKLRLVGRVRHLIKDDSSEKEYAECFRRLYDGIVTIVVMVRLHTI